jgi:hypothetical protein
MALLNTNIGPERIQVFDVPLGTVQLPGVPTSITAFLISTAKIGAPVNTPTAVTKLSDFEDVFGDADDVANDAYYAVQGYFDNAGTGNTAIIVNVGSAATANDFIGSVTGATGLRALDAIDTLGLVTVPGLSIEDAYLVQPALIDYTETIRAEFGATLSTSFSLMAMPVEISKANTDTTLLTAQFKSSSGTGPYVMDVQLLSSAVAATGTYTVVDYTLLAGAVATVDGVALTEGVDWTAAVDNDTTAASLASAIDSGVSTVGAASALAVVTVTASNAGSAGNSIATLTSSPVNLAVSGATLSGGVDGDADLSAVKAGMIVRNASASFVSVISAADNGLDTVTVLTNPSGSFSLNDNVLIQIPSAVTYKEIVINNPSKAASWYFNNLLVTDRSASANPGDVLAIDPVGHVAGVMARIDSNTAIGGVSHAAAGIQNAGIAGILGLSLSVSERLDGEPLRKNFINRIQAFPGAGKVIFGAYTADSGTSPLFTADEQLSQVIRSVQFIKGSLERGLRAFLWENFSPDTQDEVARAIESFLRNNSYLFPAGLPEAQQFRVVSVEPTQDELDQGLLRVRVQIKPNKAVRFIEVALEFPLPTA